MTHDPEPNGPSFAGRLLIAMPDMPDPMFARSVIALCVHDSAGAMGIDLGTEMDGVTLHVLLDSFGLDCSGVPDRPVLRGGPVEPRRGFILHSLDWEGEHMMPMADGWGICGSLDILKHIAAGSGPARFVVALGYAGWAAGQLDQELAQPGWFLADSRHDILFDTPAEQRWSATFARCGVDPHLIASQSGHA